MIFGRCVVDPPDDEWPWGLAVPVGSWRGLSDREVGVLRGVTSIGFDEFPSEVVKGRSEVVQDIAEDGSVAPETGRRDREREAEAAGVIRVYLGREIAEVAAHVVANGLFEGLDVFLSPINFDEDEVGRASHGLPLEEDARETEGPGTDDVHPEGSAGSGTQARGLLPQPREGGEATEEA
jgi:hypothetical protein